MKSKIILTIFIPLMVTLFLVIFLPTALLIFANPRQQNLYSSYQLKTHSLSLQNILYQDQKIVQKLLQNCEDIKNSLISMFLMQSTYQTGNVAIQEVGDVMANGNQSMYYNMEGVDNNQTLKGYQNVQMYIRGFIPNVPSILSLQWTFQSGIKFLFPSFLNNMTSSSQIFDTSYNTTLSNFNNNHSLFSIFLNSTILQSCTPLINSSGGFIGSVCMFLNASRLLGSGLVITTKEMYSLVLAMTILEKGQNPQIVFASDRDGVIGFPTEPAYVEMINNNIEALWLETASYKFYIELTGPIVWYQFPITLYTYTGSPQYTFFLYSTLYVDINQYSIGVSASYLVQIIVIPICLFFVSALVSYFVLNKMINVLIAEIDLLVKKSQSLLDGDLDVRVPEYKETMEVRKVYEEFQRFAEVVRYSFKGYFAGSTTDRNVKYYKALKLFSDLRNSTVVGNIYENLANICNEQDNLPKAAQYYKSSLQSVQQLIVSQFSQRTGQNSVLGIYRFLYQTRKRIPDQHRHLQATLIRRYYNYIQVSFRIANKSSFCNDQNMRGLLRGIEQFSVILKQRKNDPNVAVITIMCAEIYLSKGHTQEVEGKLAIAEGLYREYKDQFEEGESGASDGTELPPEIIYQYLSLIWGDISQQENRPLEAFQYYVAALDGETYDPLVRDKIMTNLKKLLVMQYLSSSSVRESVYFQLKTHDPKEYFLIVDFSLSMATKVRVHNQIQSRTQLAIQQALRIFDQHIKPHDRVSLIRFESGMQQIFNLTQKGKYQQMLRETIDQMQRAELKDGTAIYNTLKAVLSNTRQLKKQKILVFLLDGADNCSNVTTKDIQEIARAVDSITILFVYIDMKEEELEELYELRNFCQTCYFVSIYAEDDINRILKGKNYEKRYPQSYIL